MPDPLQDQLKTTRRKHILDAAARVFARKGFKAATIKDVAREAGIGDGSLYYHFENKGALLLGLFEEVSRSAQQTLPPMDLRDADLRTVLMEHLRQPLSAPDGQHAELFKAVLTETLVNPELATRFFQEVLQPMVQGAQHLIEGWATGHGVTLRHPQTSGQLVCALLIGLLYQRMLGDERLQAHWDEVPAQVADLILHGLILEEHP